MWIVPIYYSSFHFLFHYPHITPTYPIFYLFKGDYNTNIYPIIIQ